ncbi:MAG: hypothetical protein KDK12_10180 [Rhodobacteraceae bacterium]|nr:hypothetical protein [Paracoccaceae bacterium]
MHRRHFLTSLAAAGVAATTATGARAERGDLLLAGNYYPVRLNENGESTRIDHLVVTDGRVSLSIDWTSGAPLYAENRADLSGLGGGLGDLFRTPFRVRWRRAHPVGSVDINPGRNMLIARVEDASGLQNAAATIGAGDHSWDLPGRFGGRSRPAQGRAAGAARIDDDGRLLIHLPQMVAQF